jgi:hypothetical protein
MCVGLHAPLSRGITPLDYFSKKSKGLPGLTRLKDSSGRYSLPASKEG